MSKRTEQAAIDHGEALLREWGTGSDAESLRGAWGRDADADLAIVARLAHLETAESALLLADLARTAKAKAVQKEVRRALFRLSSRGVATPKEQPAATVATLGTVPIEGYMSASDGNGDQLLWLVKPLRGELMQLFAVINDPQGMREAEMHPVTRKVLRSAREDLAAKHEIVIVEVDWRYCDARMAQAHEWASKRGAPVSGDYLGQRGYLLQSPPVNVPHPIFARVDRAEILADAALLEASPSLCDEKELRTWFFPATALEPTLRELEKVQESPLLLAPHQQRERAEEVTERAVEDLFGGEARESWGRRLLDLAHVLYATGRAAAARQAVAVALALEKSERGGRGIPLCETLVRASLAIHLRAAAEKEQQRARESLILTPQEAAAQAEAARRGGPR